MDYETKDIKSYPISQATRPGAKQSSLAINPIQPSEKLAPRWMVFRPLSGWTGLNNALKKAHKGLKKVASVLDTAKSAVQAAKAIVSLIAAFESMLKNVLFSFIDLILDQAQKALDDAKSTGVYMLDMTSYHWQKKAQKSATEDLDFLQEIKGGDWANVQKQANEIINSRSTSGNEKVSWVDQWADLTAAAVVSSSSGMTYKKETYNQFINTVCDAFLDKNDLPDSSVAYALTTTIASQLDSNKSTSDEKAKNSEYLSKKAFDMPMEGKIWGDTIAYPNPRFLQSGRPNFGDNGTMKVVFIVFAFPRIEELMYLVDIVSKLIGKEISAVVDKTVKGIEYVASAPWKLGFGEPDQKASTQKSDFTNFLRDGILQAVDKSKLGPQKNFFDMYDKVGINTQPARGKEPNFMGVNAYTLAAPLFDALQTLIDWLRSMTIDIETGLLQNILNILDSIEKEIDALIKIVVMLDHFISMIEAILSITGVRILIFSTNRGNAGVVEALRNAKGFNEDAKTDDVAAAKVALKENISVTTAALSAATDRLAQASQASSSLATQVRPASELATQITTMTVDKVYFKSKNLPIPVSYSLDVPQSTWSTYPTKVSALYTYLNDMKTQLISKQAEAATAQSDVANLRILLDDQKEQLRNAEPGASERRRQAIAASEIRVLEGDLTTMQAKAADCSVRYNNLMFVKNWVDQWVTYTNTEQLRPKQAAYDVMVADFNAQIKVHQDAIALLQLNETIPSKITKLQQDMDWNVHGHVADKYGPNITGYEPQILAKNLEQQALRDQNNDQTQPQPANFDARDAALTNEIAALTAEQVTYEAACNSNIDDWTIARNFVNLAATNTSVQADITALNLITPRPVDYAARLAAFNQQITNNHTAMAALVNEYGIPYPTWITTVATEYEDAKAVVEGVMAQLRLMNYPEHSGSEAEAFRLYDEARDVAILAHENQLTVLNGEVSSYGQAKGRIYGQIALLGLDADAYNPGDPLPVAPDPPWNNTTYELFQGKITPIVLPDDLGYWAIKTHYDNILAVTTPPAVPGLRQAELNGIIEQKNLKAINLAAWNNFSADNIRIQTQIWGIVLNALPDLISIRDHNAQIVLLNAHKTLDTGTALTEINRILDYGWIHFLVNNNIYYQNKVPSRIKNTDGTEGWSNWTGNEVGYLIALGHGLPHGYSLRQPYVSSENATVLNTAMDLIRAEKVAIDLQVNNASSARDTAKAAEDTKKKKANDTAALQKMWSPSQKMYYGGYLFCMGWPNYTAEDANGKPAYFNISQYYKTVSGSTKDSIKNATKGFEKQWTQITSLFGKEKK